MFGPAAASWFALKSRPTTRGAAHRDAQAELRRAAAELERVEPVDVARARGRRLLGCPRCPSRTDPIARGSRRGGAGSRRCRPPSRRGWTRTSSRLIGRASRRRCRARRRRCRRRSTARCPRRPCGRGRARPARAPASSYLVRTRPSRAPRRGDAATWRRELIMPTNPAGERDRLGEHLAGVGRVVVGQDDGVALGERDAVERGHHRLVAGRDAFASRLDDHHAIAQRLQVTPDGTRDVGRGHREHARRRHDAARRRPRRRRRGDAARRSSPRPVRARLAAASIACVSNSAQPSVPEAGPPGTIVIACRPGTAARPPPPSPPSRRPTGRRPPRSGRAASLPRGRSGAPRSRPPSSSIACGSTGEDRLERLPHALRRPRQVHDQRRRRSCRRSPRDSAAIGVCASPAARISSASPGASRSSTALVASGVTSRGPNPVPPVVTTSVCDAARRTQRPLDRRRARPATTSRDGDVEAGAGEQLLAASPEPSARVPRGDAVGDREDRSGRSRHRVILPPRRGDRRQAVGCSASTIPAATAGRRREALRSA